MTTEMFVYRVLIDLHGNALVVLADEAAERLLHIYIGPFEAQAIARVLKDEQFERPLTHDLLSVVINTLGYQLQWVTITRLEDSTFFALLTLVEGSATVDIDARPSDAIALALRAGAPILVAEEVLDKAAISATQMRDDAEEIERFKDLMSDINVPDSATDRDTPPSDESDRED